MSSKKSNDPERPAIRALGRLTPQQWAERVLQVPDEIRPQVARVVWYDWFGQRESHERWPHLDCYLKNASFGHLIALRVAGATREQIAEADYGKSLSQSELAEQLIALGYPPNYAMKRSYYADHRL